LSVFFYTAKVHRPQRRHHPHK